MSDYTGPGVYEFIAGNAPTRRMNAWGGGTAVGQAVKLYAATSPGATGALNALWEIVAAGGDSGNPEIGDRQYHIVGVESGLMLCAAADGSNVGCTLSTRSVRHGSCRWKIIPTGNGSYYFANVLGPNKYLAVSGAADADGADLVTWEKQTNTHFQFQLKRPSY